MLRVSMTSKVMQDVYHQLAVYTGPLGNRYPHVLQEQQMLQLTRGHTT